MQKIISKLNPVYILVVHLAAIICSPLIIKLDESRLFLLAVYAVLPILLSIVLGVAFQQNTSNHRKTISIPLNYLKLISIIVFFCTVLEFAYFGIPLFGQISYHKLGFTIIHHISVSSWVWVILAFGQSSRKIHALLLVAALINPVLMLNRDLLMLTFFVIVALTSRQDIRISNKFIFLIFCVCFYVFSLLGEIRSPSGLELFQNNLPLSNFSNSIFDFDKKLLWPLIYFSGSIFNAANHLAGFQALYYENLNAVSEFVRFYIYIGAFSPYIFYLGTTIFLLIMNKLSYKSAYFDWFYIYAYYQFIMSIFSTKFYITNTLFVFLLFCVVPSLLPRKAKN